MIMKLNVLKFLLDEHIQAAICDNLLIKRTKLNIV